MKSLIAILLTCFAVQAFADVPAVDPVTRKIKKEFASGHLPTIQELMARRTWSCNLFSASPNSNEVIVNHWAHTFNEFNGIIMDHHKQVEYNSPFDSGLVESADGKSLERTAPASEYGYYGLRHFNFRIYKGHLFIESSVEILPDQTQLYGESVALYDHAASNPGHALVSLWVCPLY
jgi:hypothetical protein